MQFPFSLGINKNFIRKVGIRYAPDKSHAQILQGLGYPITGQLTIPATTRRLTARPTDVQTKGLP